jgi:hypothetical protein
MRHEKLLYIIVTMLRPLLRGIPFLKYTAIKSYLRKAEVEKREEFPFRDSASLNNFANHNEQSLFKAPAPEKASKFYKAVRLRERYLYRKEIAFIWRKAL